MLYDMSIKRAERLLRKNWAACQREAHRLAAEGLPVEVGETELCIRAPSFTVVLRASGDNYIPFTVGNPSAGARDVAQALQDILGERERQAQEMGLVAAEMAKVK